MAYSYIVVDDETIIRQGLIKKIKKLRMPLECKGQAANGAEGLKLIELADPDIVITDMKMPEMDGTAFLDRISARYPDKKVIVLSSYKDFEYMNTAIETGVVGYVLKPFSAEEMQKQLKKAIDRIETQRSIHAQAGFMREHMGIFESRMSSRQLLNLVIHPMEAGVASQTEFDQYRDVRSFLLITIRTNNPSLLPHLEEICRDGARGISAVPLEDASHKYSYFILLLDYEGHGPVLESYAGELAGRLKEVGRPFVQYICISHACNNINDVHGLYKSCTDALTGVRLAGRESVLRPQKRIAQGMHTDEQIKDLFIHMRYSPDTIADVLGGFFDELAAGDATYEVLHMECGSLIRLVNEYAVQYGVETEDIMGVFYDRYIFDTEIERIKRELTGYISLIFSSVRNSYQSQERLMESIKQYIDKNCGSKITLESVASKFFINPTYCSYLFKLKTQESFNEHITRIRMEKAMKFLSETGMSIDSVSKEVGYRNPKYFFKIFKKYKGLTPTEYRNRKQR